ncbi:MAG: iron complex transport system substrate-binding protein [Myxococcota bacterium]|jgi:iron complex transport system substrate-binding protein
MRVISLTCSNTEIVCALGLGHTLVGVDDHSDHPASVLAGLPRVGPDLSIDIDAVEALRPDCVLASLTVPGHERIVTELKARGIPHIAPEPISLADVYDDIHAIAAALGAPERAQALVDQMQATFAAGEPNPDLRSSRPAVLVEWWPKPVIVPGRQSWVTDLITLAGGRNPMGDRDVKSSPVTDEEVVAWSPDAVVICWCGVPFEKYRPDVVTRRAAWQALPALRDQQVHCIPEAFLGRPGPRLMDGFQALRAVVDAVHKQRSAAWHDGSCHCGAVRFQVRIDRWEAIDCSCSICRKKGIVHLIVERDAFRLLTGVDALSTYTFGTHTAKHHFCRTCGMHPFYVPRSHPDSVDVNVRALDDVPLSRFTVTPFDGDRWEANIDQIR